METDQACIHGKEWNNTDPQIKQMKKKWLKAEVEKVVKERPTPHRRYRRSIETLFQGNDE